MRRLSLTETSIPVPETGFDDPELAAVSQVIQFQNWNEPTQVHLALTGDPTEMMYVIHSSVYIWALGFLCLGLQKNLLDSELALLGSFKFPGNHPYVLPYLVIMESSSKGIRTLCYMDGVIIFRRLLSSFTGRVYCMVVASQWKCSRSSYLLTDCESFCYMVVCRPLASHAVPCGWAEKPIHQKWGGAPRVASTHTQPRYVNPLFTVRYVNPLFTVRYINPLFTVRHVNPLFTVRYINPLFTVRYN